MAWSDFPERARSTFRAFRSPAGEDMILRDNAFVERVLPGSIIRQLFQRRDGSLSQTFHKSR
jgi:haloalkane dehalogenase